MKHIISQSNKDIRCAITTLQFVAAGKTEPQKVLEVKLIKKRKMDVDPASPGKLKDNLDKFKDFSLTVFHALAKFLYNKRVAHPEAKSMPPEIMLDPKRRP